MCEGGRGDEMESCAVYVRHKALRPGDLCKVENRTDTYEPLQQCNSQPKESHDMVSTFSPGAA